MMHQNDVFRCKCLVNQNIFIPVLLLHFLPIIKSVSWFCKKMIYDTHYLNREASEV